jgi:hypothetical protein
MDKVIIYINKKYSKPILMLLQTQLHAQSVLPGQKLLNSTLYQNWKFIAFGSVRKNWFYLSVYIVLNEFCGLS